MADSQPTSPSARVITKSVRVSNEQWDRVERAAAIETSRLGRTVYPSALLAEIGMDGINAILVAAEAAAVVLE